MPAANSRSRTPREIQDGPADEATGPPVVFASFDSGLLRSICFCVAVPWYTVGLLTPPLRIEASGCIPMKIAFDGTVLYGRKSGVGYYCEELLKAMLSMNHADQFYVFSHQPVDLDIAASNGNLKFTNSFHFPVRAFYLHALLPRILDKVQPDLCHYTNFLAPITEDRPYVVTIHDMGLEVLRYAHPLAKRLYT